VFFKQRSDMTRQSVWGKDRSREGWCGGVRCNCSGLGVGGSHGDDGGGGDLGFQIYFKLERPCLLVECERNGNI
jgi:hypothetical protein